MRRSKKFCLIALCVAGFGIPTASAVASSHTDLIYTTGALLDDNGLRDAGTISGGIASIGWAASVVCGVQLVVGLSLAL